MWCLWSFVPNVQGSGGEFFGPTQTTCLFVESFEAFQLIGSIAFVNPKNSSVLLSSSITKRIPFKSHREIPLMNLAEELSGKSWATICCCFFCALNWFQLINLQLFLGPQSIHQKWSTEIVDASSVSSALPADGALNSLFLLCLVSSARERGGEVG